MEDLITHMINCGWTKNEDGSVSHPECATYDSWHEAIMSCIEVATGV